MELTDEEKGIVGLVRLKKLWPKPKTKEWLIDKKFSVGRFKVHIEKRSKEELWSRFGGGWQYELGIQIGLKTVIINWLVGSLRISQK